MRILIFNWQDIKNPLAGGAEVHLHEVFSRIAGLGHEVTLYCSSFPGAPPEEMMKGLRVIRQGGRNFFNYRVAFAYLSRFRSEPFDIVIDDMNKIPFFTPLYVDKPLYAVTHHLFGKSIFKEANVVAAMYVYLTELAAVALYRRRKIPFIVGSPSTAEELEAKGFPPENVTVINYAVDHDLHKRTGIPKHPTHLIGYFGRLKKYKSVDHLLRALPEVLKRVPNLKLLIVGDGDDRGRLNALAEQLGVSGAVEFTGFVSEEKKVALLKSMWFKVTTSSKEGWGLTVLEANACGTTVLASDVPGLRDAVKDGETGLLYPYGDINELARKIVYLVEQPAIRDRLTSGALAWAASFRWDTAAERTIALLQARLTRGNKQS